jgi:hypothetical protein
MLFYYHQLQNRRGGVGGANMTPSDIRIKFLLALNDRNKFNKMNS